MAMMLSHNHRDRDSSDSHRRTSAEAGTAASGEALDSGGTGATGVEDDPAFKPPSLAPSSSHQLAHPAGTVALSSTFPTLHPSPVNHPAPSYTTATATASLAIPGASASSTTPSSVSPTSYSPSSSSSPSSCSVCEGRHSLGGSPDTTCSCSCSSGSGSSLPEPSGTGPGHDSWKRQQQRREEQERQEQMHAYMRPCAFLRPGSIFTGSQSFTAYLSPASSTATSAIVSAAYLSESPYRSTARRQQLHPSTQYPFTAFSRDLPSWSDISGSAIDPRIQALLGAVPSFVDYPSSGSFSSVGGGGSGGGGEGGGSATARVSTKEEWEVQVSISHVDYEKGRVRGIMMAKNVPSAVSAMNGHSQSQSATGGGEQASTTSAQDLLDSTVTTSFEGEIVDLHNNGIWTRSSPEGWQSYLSSKSAPSSPRGEGLTSWLAQNGVVDKTTDLEYWSKVEAFSGFGASAEKEICRIARENRWTPMTRKWMTDPREYILMRWKGE